MMDGFYGGGFGHMMFPGFGILIQLILIIIFVIVIFWVVRSGNFSNDTPEDILKKRLAKGEITRKEYEDLKKELLK